jgi:hypothetical protein
MMPRQSRIWPLIPDPVGRTDGRARRNEIDLEQAAWTVPASRMKAGREHRVPLAPRCLDLLQQAKLLAAGNEFVFPGRSNDKAMSNMVWLMTKLSQLDMKFNARQRFCYVLNLRSNIDAKETFRASQISNRRAALTRLRPFSYFLNLLKRDAQFLAEVGLAHFDCKPALAHAGADIGVDGARVPWRLCFSFCFFHPAFSCRSTILFMPGR